MFFGSSTTRCCAAPSFLAAGPLWVSQRHHSMSAMATAFADSGHRAPLAVPVRNAPRGLKAMGSGGSLVPSSRTLAGRRKGLPMRVPSPPIVGGGGGPSGSPRKTHGRTRQELLGPFQYKREKPPACVPCGSPSGCPGEADLTLPAPCLAGGRALLDAGEVERAGRSGPRAHRPSRLVREWPGGGRNHLAQPAVIPPN
jgi:hypothetical protein